MSQIIVDIPKRAFLPCYHHLLESQADIDFLYGGRDSGKSRFIAQKLLIDCLSLPYFRCVLARKVFNTIKESQWQLLKDVAEEWGIDHLFNFRISPLEITCKNGNKFICRGMDEPGKLKSISNPSHCWAEEMNQLELDDFVVIMTSLRYNKGRVKVWCSFNPECDGDFADYWLYKTFFAGRDLSFADTWTIEIPGSNQPPVNFNYTSTHTTYHDNRFCKPERAAFLEQLKILDPYYYIVFTLGKWGRRKIEDPFCHCFDKSKHVGVTALRRELEVALSFDFNVNPITCGVYQSEGNDIWSVENIKLSHSNIYKLCEYIKAHYPGCVFRVTGDATGRATSALVQDALNYYTIIKSELDLGSSQIKVPPANPRIEENRALVNAAFTQRNCTFHPEKSKELIFDCENVSVDDMGKIEKGDRSNPKKRADHLDNWRYYLNTFHKHILKS